MIQSVFTYSEHSSDGVLLTEDEGTAVPKGQSVRQVDHQEGESHGDVSRDRLPYPHRLSILQVLVISGKRQTCPEPGMERNKNVQAKLDCNETEARQMQH